MESSGSRPFHHRIGPIVQPFQPPIQWGRAALVCGALLVLGDHPALSQHALDGREALVLEDGRWKTTDATTGDKGSDAGIETTLGLRFGGYLWEAIGAANLLGDGPQLRVDLTGGVGGARVDLGSTAGVEADFALTKSNLLAAGSATVWQMHGTVDGFATVLGSLTATSTLVGDVQRHDLAPTFDTNPTTYGVAFLLDCKTVRVESAVQGVAVTATMLPPVRVSLTSARTIEMEGLDPNTVVFLPTGEPVDADAVVFYAEGDIEATPIHTLTVTASGLDEIAISVPTTRFQEVPLESSGPVSVSLGDQLVLSNTVPATPASVKSVREEAPGVALRLGPLDPASWPTNDAISLAFSEEEDDCVDCAKAIVTLEPFPNSTEIAASFEIKGAASYLVDLLDAQGGVLETWPVGSEPFAHFAPTSHVVEAELAEISSSPSVGITFDADTEVTLLLTGFPVTVRTLRARAVNPTALGDHVQRAEITFHDLPSLMIEDIKFKHRVKPSEDLMLGAQVSIFTCGDAQAFKPWTYYVCIDNTLGSGPLANVQIQTTHPVQLYNPRPIPQPLPPPPPPLCRIGDLCWPDLYIPLRHRCVVGVEGIAPKQNSVMQYDSTITVPSQYMGRINDVIQVGSSLSSQQSTCAQAMCSNLVLCGDDDNGILFFAGFETGDCSEFDRCVP